MATINTKQHKNNRTNFLCLFVLFVANHDSNLPTRRPQIQTRAKRWWTYIITSGCRRKAATGRKGEGVNCSTKDRLVDRHCVLVDRMYPALEVRPRQPTDFMVVTDHTFAVRGLPFSERPTRRLGCVGWLSAFPTSRTSMADAASGNRPR